MHKQGHTLIIHNVSQISLLLQERLKHLCNGSYLSLNGDVSRLLTTISPLLLSFINEAELSYSEPVGGEPVFRGFSSVTQLCPTLCDPMDHSFQAFLSITNCWRLPKLMSIGLVMPSNHLILCHPLLLLPSIMPSIRVFSSESVLCTRWPKYWSFSFSISPSNEYSGLISFRIYWLDLLAVQGTLKSLLQHHSSKASILWSSPFFIVQLSHPYMTTGKTIALTKWTFVSKVMSLLFNMLSRLFIAFLPRSKHLLISWLQSLSAVILEPPKIKSLFPLFSHLFAMK